MFNCLLLYFRITNRCMDYGVRFVYRHLYNGTKYVYCKIRGDHFQWLQVTFRGN